MTIHRGRAPLRLSLAGGGTDVDPYAERFGGRVLNATIDKYAYAYVERTGSGVEFHSPDRQNRGDAALDDIASLQEDFPLHVAVYRRLIKEFNNGELFPLKMATQVDAPPGSGLGSSSTLVVAMITAMTNLLGLSLGPYELARMAWEIERVELGMAGGWQDQYAAAFGGFNYIESRPGQERIIVNPLRVRREITAELEASLLLYFGGVSRNSSEVIHEQQQRITDGDQSATEATHLLREEAELMKDNLLTGDMEGMAATIRRGWVAKRKLASTISTTAIEKAYEVAAAHGMIAGKVTGAGGGGFMLLMVDPERRLEVERSQQEECGGFVLNVQFTYGGAESWQVAGRVKA